MTGKLLLVPSNLHLRPPVIWDYLPKIPNSVFQSKNWTLVKHHAHQILASWAFAFGRLFCFFFRMGASSETQGQIVGARESLNRRKNVARRKVKIGEKSPWGQCLTRPVPNGHRRSAFWSGGKTQKFSGTNQKSERRRPFGTGLVRHCPQGLFSPFFTFLLCHIFPPV